MVAHPAVENLDILFFAGKITWVFFKLTQGCKLTMLPCTRANKPGHSVKPTKVS